MAHPTTTGDPRWAATVPHHRHTGADLAAPLPRELRDLVAPHVDSYDYFLAHGLAKVVAGLEKVEVREEERRRGGRVGRVGCPPARSTHYHLHPISLQYEHPATGVVHRFWFEGAAVGTPERDDGGGRLMPRDCREAVSRVGRGSWTGSTTGK